MALLTTNTETETETEKEIRKKTEKQSCATRKINEQNKNNENIMKYSYKKLNIKCAINKTTTPSAIEVKVTATAHWQQQSKQPTLACKKKNNLKEPTKLTCTKTKTFKQRNKK